MLKAGWKLTMVVCLVAGLVGASPAQASDAGLRKIVKRHEGRVVPLAKKFSAADKALATAPDTSAASAADQALRVGLRKFKVAVVPIKTQTAEREAGQEDAAEGPARVRPRARRVPDAPGQGQRGHEQGLAAPVLRHAQQAPRRRRRRTSRRP